MNIEFVKETDFFIESQGFQKKNLKTRVQQWLIQVTQECLTLG